MTFTLILTQILLVWNGTDWEQVILGGDSVWTKDGNNIVLRSVNDVQVGGIAAEPNISLNASGSGVYGTAATQRGS